MKNQNFLSLLRFSVVGFIMFTGLQLDVQAFELLDSRPISVYNIVVDRPDLVEGFNILLKIGAVSQTFEIFAEQSLLAQDLLGQELNIDITLNEAEEFVVTKLKEPFLAILKKIIVGTDISDIDLDIFDYVLRAKFIMGNVKPWVNQQYMLGMSLLHFIVNAPFVGQLVKMGADVNIQDNYQQTPLLWAVRRDAVDVARELIDAGADINIPDAHGKTPLDFATTEEMKDVLNQITRKKRALSDSDDSYSYSDSDSDLDTDDLLGLKFLRTL